MPNRLRRSRERPWMTKHARDRHASRVGGRPGLPTRLSTSTLVEVSRRVVTARWDTALSRRRGDHKGQRFFASASALYVTRGGAVVTVVRVTEDDLAALLVWAATGIVLEAGE